MQLHTSVFRCVNIIFAASMSFAALLLICACLLVFGDISLSAVPTLSHGHQ